MTTLTIRIPDDTAARLRELARHRGISLNKLMEEFSATGLAEFDTETRFRLRAARGSAALGLALLDRLDARLGKQMPRRGPAAGVPVAAKGRARRGRRA